MHGWQANKKRTCAQPVVFRAMPENEKPPAMRADIYCCERASKRYISGGVKTTKSSVVALFDKLEFVD
jgi:hypothetical protein